MPAENIFLHLESPVIAIA